MQCAKCGGQNPADAFFCGTCGVQLRSSFAANGPVQLGANSEDAIASSGAGVHDTVEAPVLSNPFTDAEPTAKRAFEQGFGAAARERPSEAWSPDDPGAGLSPPPPHLPPPAPQYHAPPPPSGYAPAPPMHAAGPGAARAYGPVGLPADGNTSGMGDGFPLPPEASGWTFAGFVPFGLFSFNNGNSTWGIIGLLLWFFGFSIVYWVYVGITGKENAWRNRRFDSIAQYVETMRAWNAWGIGLLIAGIAFILIYIVLVFAIIGAGIASGDLQ